MREVIAFYAWQSDTPQHANRHLIRMALEMASANINADASLAVELKIDSDTEGVVGQIPVTDTILNKIGACDIFIPDLTYIAVTTAGKAVPNPNVLLEYGYAIRAKSYGAMLAVMNIAFGPPTALPFDMGYLKHPVQYDLVPTASNAARRAARQTLANEFERILRMMIASLPAKQVAAAKLFPEAKAQRPPAFFFKKDEILASFGNPGEQEVRFIGDSALYLRLFPESADQPRVTLAKMVDIFRKRRPTTMTSTIGGVVGQNDYGPILADLDGQTSIAGFTQGFPTGELWGVTKKSITRVRNQMAGVRGPDHYDLVHAITLEKLILGSLGNYVRIARDDLGLKLPYVVEIGIVGIKDHYLFVPSREFANGDFVGPIRVPSLHRRFRITDLTEAAWRLVIREFFEEVYDLAALDRNGVLTDQLVAGHNLVPRREETE